MMSRTKLPAPLSDLPSLLPVLALIDSLGLPSLPRTTRVHKFGTPVGVDFRAFYRRTWHYQDVGKRSDSRRDPDEAQQALPSGDVALVFGKNGDGVHILRRRDENSPVEAGLLQPLVERASTGPSQVATDSYRKGWDAIWGGRAKASGRDLN